MTAKDHNRLIGIFFLIWGGLQIVGLGVAILVMLFAGGAAMLGARTDEAAPLAAVFGFTTLILFVVMIFAIPSIVAGMKMRKQNPSAKVWAIIAAILALGSVPIGTALGVYALWFWFGEQGKAFYSGAQANGGNYFNQPPPNSWR